MLEVLDVLDSRLMRERQGLVLKQSQAGRLITLSMAPSSKTTQACLVGHGCGLCNAYIGRLGADVIGVDSVPCPHEVVPQDDRVAVPAWNDRTYAVPCRPPR